MSELPDRMREATPKIYLINWPFLSYPYVDGQIVRKWADEVEEIIKKPEVSMTTEVYVAVWKDRHVDDHIELFTKMIKALKWITEKQLSYDDFYSWEDNHDWQENGPWEYHVRSDIDDGPKGYIVRKELQ